MRIFGRELTLKKIPENLQPISGNGGWWPWIRESFTGAWQQNVEIRQDTVLAYSAVFACVTLIASDIGKLRPKLVQDSGNGVWDEVTKGSPFLPVISKPNNYQNRIKFIEAWIVSKLVHGNAYVLKVRDNRQMVIKLYVLNPLRVKVLVAMDGSVYYELQSDPLSTIPDETLFTVPASEIIHDTMVCLHHPLVGVSPIYACGLAATQGNSILQNSTKFFQNQSRPSGALTAPGSISDETAARLKAAWESNFGGENIGKLAVLGDGLKYEPMYVSATDSQLIEQLKMTAETVCSCFHVPGYKVGVGPMPMNNNVEALDQQYYSQCLQTLIESLELCLDEGLGLPDHYGVELDLDGLLRMDTATLTSTLKEGVSGGMLSPDEARRKLGYGPVAGGATPYLQQQNFSLAALAKRDALANPFVIDKPTTNPTPSAEGPAQVADPSTKELLERLDASMQLTIKQIAPLALPALAFEKVA